MPKYRKSKDGLTPLQRRFVAEYFIDLNATQACIRAGYKAKNATKIGPRLVGKGRVAQVIAEKQAEYAKRVDVTSERLVREFARLSFSDMRRFSEFGPNGVTIRDAKELSDDDAACIAEVSQTTTKEGGSIKFKLHDKVSALTQLAKHLGITPESVRQVRGVDGQPGQYEDVPTYEQIAAERNRIVGESVKSVLAGLGHRGNGQAGGNGSDLQHDDSE